MGEAAKVETSRAICALAKIACGVLLVAVAVAVLSYASTIVIPVALSPVPLSQVPADFARSVAKLVTDCALTAVVEELIFRGALLLAFVWVFRSVDPPAPHGSVLLRATIAQAAVFALAHLLGIPELSEVSLIVVALQAVAKFAQGFFFAICMAYFFLKTSNLILPIAIHFAFDLIYFAPFVFEHGDFPATYLTGSFVDLAILVTSALLLAFPARHALHELNRDSASFVPHFFRGSSC